MRKVLLLLFLAASTGLLAQSNIKDSVISFPMFSLSYAYQLPAGTIAKRFGPNSDIGASLLWKNRKNWIFGFEGTFIFGEDIRETGIFDQIATKTIEPGILIDNSGIPGDIQTFERGFTLSGVIGKVIPVTRKGNPNSGILLMVKGGYFQHKIRIEDIAHSVPQLDDDYAKGYDRLNTGYSLQEFIGYQYLSEHRLINFFAGFEFLQAVTKSKRYDFDLMKQDFSTHHDFLNGFRVGWILPLYKKVPHEYYYN